MYVLDFEFWANRMPCLGGWVVLRWREREIYISRWLQVHNQNITWPAAYEGDTARRGLFTGCFQVWSLGTLPGLVYAVVGSLVVLCLLWVAFLFWVGMDEVVCMRYRDIKRIA